MMCFYDPAKFEPRRIWHVEEGAMLKPGTVIWLSPEPDLDDLIGMDDPGPESAPPMKNWHPGYWPAALHYGPVSDPEWRAMLRVFDGQ